MKKLAISLGIAVALSAVAFDVRAATGQIPETASTPGWVLAVGVAFGLSWIVFILSSIICTFCIDRKKVAEAEYWFIAGYTFPPRKYLKESGHAFAVVRFYSLIASGVLLVVVLAIVP